MTKISPIYRKMKSIVDPGGDKSYLGDDDLVEARYRNLLVRFHLRNRAIDLARLLGTIRRIQLQIEEKLEIPIQPVEVEICSTREEWGDEHTDFGEGDAPSWVEGDSGRIIRIIMAKNDPDEFPRLQLMVTHEVVHHSLRTLGNGPIPAWLDEGLAVSFSQELPRKYADVLKTALDGDAYLPIETLEKAFSRFDRQIKTLAYAQSTSLVEYLIDHHGWDSIKSILEGLARGDTLDAMLRPLGLNAYLLEKEWISFTKRRL